MWSTSILEPFFLPPGEITVQKPQGLDFEEGRLTHLVVLADSGMETTHSRVAVTLKDVNDNAPLFDYAYYRTAVWEGQVHNTYIMQVLKPKNNKDGRLTSGAVLIVTGRLPVRSPCSS